MRIETCHFCSSNIYPGHGIAFVRNDGKVWRTFHPYNTFTPNHFKLMVVGLQIFKFCRPKCHKAFKVKKNPRKVRWTKAYRRTHGKEMAHVCLDWHILDHNWTFLVFKDATFDFERRQSIPVRYNRELYLRTLQAMKRVQEIRSRRERQYYIMRSARACGLTWSYWSSRMATAKRALKEAIERVCIILEGKAHQPSVQKKAREAGQVTVSETPEDTVETMPVETATTKAPEVKITRKVPQKIANSRRSATTTAPSLSFGVPFTPSSPQS